MGRITDYTTLDSYQLTGDEYLLLETGAGTRNTTLKAIIENVVNTLPEDIPEQEPSGGGSGGSTVTEQTVASWGFTKNTGNYSKPLTGIPETDLSEDVISKLNGIPSGGSGSGEVDEYKTIVPDIMANYPSNTLMNERSLRDKFFQLSDDTKKAHNLAMCMLGSYVFATWIEYDSTDYADGRSQCTEKWALIKITNTVKAKIENWTAKLNEIAFEKILEGTLFVGKSISTGTITDASDVAIFRISDAKIAVIAKVTCGTSTPYVATATIEFSGYTSAPTITYTEPTIDGGAWDFTRINSSFNRFYQFNNEPSLVNGTYYFPVVVDGEGVQILSTTDGKAFTKYVFIPCEHAYLECALAMTNATKLFIAIRSGYNNGALYLITANISGNNANIVSKSKINGMGSARPHIIKLYTQGCGGTVNDMPFFVLATNNQRNSAEVLMIRTYNGWGSGTITGASVVASWGEYSTYPCWIDYSKSGNISAVLPMRYQLIGGTNHATRKVGIFPAASVIGKQTTAFYDGIDLLAVSESTQYEPVVTPSGGSGDGKFTKIASFSSNGEATYIGGDVNLSGYSEVVFIAKIATVSANLQINIAPVTGFNYSNLFATFTNVTGDRKLRVYCTRIDDLLLCMCGANAPTIGGSAQNVNYLGGGNISGKVYCNTNTQGATFTGTLDIYAK